MFKPAALRGKVGPVRPIKGENRERAGREFGRHAEAVARRPFAGQQVGDVGHARVVADDQQRAGRGRLLAQQPDDEEARRLVQRVPPLGRAGATPSGGGDLESFAGVFLFWTLN